MSSNQEAPRLRWDRRGSATFHRATRLECDEDAPVGAAADAVLGERGAEEVAAERLKAGAIVGGNPDVGVEVEAIELGLAGPAGGDVTKVRLVAEAADACAGAGAEGDAALDGGADEAGEDGRSLGEGVSRRAIVFGLEVAAGEQLLDAGADGAEDVGHVLVARWGCGVKGERPRPSVAEDAGGRSRYPWPGRRQQVTTIRQQTTSQQRMLVLTVRRARSRERVVPYSVSLLRRRSGGRCDGRRLP